MVRGGGSAGGRGLCVNRKRVRAHRRRL